MNQAALALQGSAGRLGSFAEKVRVICSIHFPFVKNAFLRMLAYRLRYYTGILTYVLFATVHYFIWKAVFSGRGEGALINGFTLNEMITYVAVGWIARSLYFSNVDEEIDELVRTGQISIFLLRPVDFQLMIFAYSLGQALFRFCFFFLPIGFVILQVFPVQYPASAGYFVLFLLSTLAGGVIFIEINYLVGLLAFVMKSTHGVMRAKYYIIQLCSGLLLPLAFFPAWLSSILELLPFKVIAYVPLQFYLGRIAWADAPSVFFGQLVWIALLGAAGRYFFYKAISRLTLQGG